MKRNLFLIAAGLAVAGAVQAAPDIDVGGVKLSMNAADIKAAIIKTNPGIVCRDDVKEIVLKPSMEVSAKLNGIRNDSYKMPTLKFAGFVCSMPGFPDKHDMYAVMHIPNGKPIFIVKSTSYKANPPQREAVLEAAKKFGQVTPSITSLTFYYDANGTQLFFKSRPNPVGFISFEEPSYCLKPVVNGACNSPWKTRPSVSFFSEKLAGDYAKIAEQYEVSQVNDGVWVSVANYGLFGAIRNAVLDKFAADIDAIIAQKNASAAKPAL